MQDTFKRVKEENIRANIAYLKDEIRQKNSEKPFYRFVSRRKNPHYESGLVELTDGKKHSPFESSLIHDKSSKKTTQKRLKNIHKVTIQTQPKNLTTLVRMEKIEGVYCPVEILETNDFKQSNNLKIKAMDKFAEHYQPLYKQKIVSLLFVTLTAAFKAKMTISQYIDYLKKTYEKNGFKMLAYVWTFEVSERNLHPHYHIAIAIPRLSVEGGKLPDWMKGNKIWGRRTEIAFVKKNVRHYMAKYFAKNQFRAIGYKSFGISKIK
jgi:hypothetical protein